MRKILIRLYAFALHIKEEGLAMYNSQISKKRGEYFKQFGINADNRITYSELQKAISTVSQPQ